jgi:hypothetical protein
MFAAYPPPNAGNAGNAERRSVNAIKLLAILY